MHRTHSKARGSIWKVSSSGQDEHIHTTSWKSDMFLTYIMEGFNMVWLDVGKTA